MVRLVNCTNCPNEIQFSKLYSYMIAHGSKMYLCSEKCYAETEARLVLEKKRLKKQYPHLDDDEITLMGISNLVKNSPSKKKNTDNIKLKLKELNKQIMSLSGKEQEDLHDEIFSLKLELGELGAWMKSHRTKKDKKNRIEFSKEIESKAKMLKKAQEREKQLFQKFRMLFEKRDRLLTKLDQVKE